uniref:Reverse transcriptase domain-containing protein n=1 Tax=Cannabis sativa TaxID=3483 RepID=A0A803NKK3_CANSA
MGRCSRTTSRIDSNCIDHGAKLSLEDQVGLLKPFTKKEIKKAIFSIPNSKYPGPGWFSSGFFKALWADLGNDISNAIKDFFQTGRMPPEFHATMITLVPKIENPSKAIDYRPIACCTTIYKCVSKLVCSRLAQVLPDLLKNYKQKNVSPRCAIIVDISKAYDTVSWDFLEDFLNAYNLPSRFIMWIMTCIRATSYSIVMNGRIQGSFKGEKGLRQGDPLSPLLFVLVMEYLTRCLQKVASCSHYRYHPMCKELKIVNLCFADDLMLFSKGTQHSVRALKDTLEEFSAMSGLSINTSKSQIYFGGVESDIKQNILRDFVLMEGSYPLRYLGVPLRPTKWKAEDFGIIIKKMRQRLHTWASRHLSYARRVQLIHSVLLGLRNYWMSIFILPQSVSKEVEKICRGFLWGWNGNRSKIHLASWEKVCLPKAYGGLGFKDGTSWNHAILAKYIWAILLKEICFGSSGYTIMSDIFYLEVVELMEELVKNEAQKTVPNGEEPKEAILEVIYNSSKWEMDHIPNKFQNYEVLKMHSKEQGLLHIPANIGPLGPSIFLVEREKLYMRMPVAMLKVEGGIVLAWNLNSFDIEIKEMSSQHIHTVVYLKHTASFESTFIYAHNETIAREDLWKIMKVIIAVQNSPWIIMRDFNLIMMLEERISLGKMSKDYHALKN